MVQAQGADLAPFPAAEAGMQRFVVRVPPVSDDDARRVQLLVGRTIEVDCNRHALGGAPVQRRTVPGWGYDYLVVPALGPVASTRMACPPSEPRRREFVSAHLPDLDSLRYNPRLPLVIYAPAGAEVRYRIFQAGPEQAAAAE
jgi:ecotin